jgi:Ca2+-binding RTX toxin-like protein
LSKLVLRLSAGLLVLLAAGSLGTAMTAGNTVPASNLGRVTPVAINAQALAPVACVAMGLTAIVTNLNGGAANELILGTGAAETLDGGTGNDCIVGGSGNDALDGRGGTDICIGGPGTDTFTRCEVTQQ